MGGCWCWFGMFWFGLLDVMDGWSLFGWLQLNLCGSSVAGVGCGIASFVLWLVFQGAVFPPVVIRSDVPCRVPLDVDVCC